MKSKPEHTCDCCTNPEIFERLLKLDVPPILCEGVVKMAASRGNYRFERLKRDADRANHVAGQRDQEALIQEMRDRLNQ